MDSQFLERILSRDKKVFPPPLEEPPVQTSGPSMLEIDARSGATKKFVIIELCVLVLFILGLVFTYFSMRRNKNQVQDTAAVHITLIPTQKLVRIITTQSPPSPTTQIDETAGWKKTMNSNGFSFMYPGSVDVLAGAAIEEKPESSTIITIREKGVNFEGPRMQIGLWDSIHETSESSSYPSSFSEFANTWYKKNVENPSVPVTIIEHLHETTFQEKPAYEFTFNCKGFEAAPIGSIGPAGVCRIIFINNNGIFYSIGFYKNTVFDRIFSTIKFE